MKAFLEDINAKKGHHSYMAYGISPARFEFFWHFHPEYELTVILKGSGRRIVGDSHENFETGDLVLIGPGLPHTWVSDSSLNEKPAAVVLQFSSNFIERFTELSEFSAVHKLLLHSRQGILFKGNKSAVVTEQMIKLLKKTGVEKITGLLQILEELVKLKQELLATALYQPIKENANRINRVCQFVQKHATENMTIHRAAALVHLSPSAFCKFFKRTTGKTFSDYVNDIRIANVCHQLIETDKQVAEIAYSNGFETLTYFNRVFLKKKGLSPREYRGLKPV